MQRKLYTILSERLHDIPIVKEQMQSVFQRGNLHEEMQR